MVHENFRWQRPFRILKQRIAAGDIGDPYYAHISFRHGYDNYRNQPYLAELERFSIMDVGLHLFDLARWLMGRWKVFIAGRNVTIPGFAARTHLSPRCVTRPIGSRCSTVRFRPFLSRSRFRKRWRGSKARGARSNLTRGYQLKLHRRGSAEVIDAVPPVPSWGEKPWHCIQDSVVATQSHWLDVLDGKSGAQPSGADNFETLKLAFAAYESAATDTVIDLKKARAA